MPVGNVLFRVNCWRIDGRSHGNGISGKPLVGGIEMINLMAEKVVKHFNGAAGFVTIVGRHFQ